MKERSIFAKLGLQNGDVIKKIAGRPLTSPEAALSLYQDLANVQGKLDLEIERRGETIVLKVTPELVREVGGQAK